LEERVGFDDLAVGDRAPPFVRASHLEAWNRFAAVNDEFVPIHMDDAAGRAAGNETGAFGMGNLRLSYIINMLTSWFGEQAEILELNVSYRSRNQKGDILTCVGEIIGKEVIGDRRVVHVRVDVITQTGLSTTPGTASVALSERLDA
jgi:acyl dehydratase